MEKDQLITVTDFDPELFHKKVMELEADGYVANRESYRVTPDMNPEDGTVVHLHSIEMTRKAV